MKPSRDDYDIWRNSATGRWFFEVLGDNTVQLADLGLLRRNLLVQPIAEEAAF